MRTKLLCIKDTVVFSFLIWLFFDIFIASWMSAFVKHLAVKDVALVVAWLHYHLGVTDTKPLITGESESEKIYSRKI